MINQVLERLDALQARLAAIDPSREIDAADKVAAIAAALRDTIEGETAVAIGGEPLWVVSRHSEPRRIAG